ncbi:MAG: carboxypeptidase-like regulatory domain-containing protein [Cyclobacteriaceae bacterium]|nr:carboxypeptidase-like regulatory domain-containing protein [Cyclobacteriaceae bacterium]
MAGLPLYAQNITEINGHIVDDANDLSLEFVNVYFKGSIEGTVTDSIGNFSLKTFDKFDSLTISFVGYHQQVIPINPGQTHRFFIRLKSQLVNLDEVVVMSGENPAWTIIREVVKKKKQHDKRTLDAYEYQSYNRIEFDIDNISTKLKKRKMISDIWESIDSTSLEKNVKGNAILPIFLSESISRYYVKNDPFARREEVQKTKVSGVAVEDGSMISQLVGTAYQDYNFYQNWLRFLEKEFISPISDSWKMFYDYEILDTLFVGNDRCFELSVFPNRKQDPAFNGKIWITTEDFALKKLDLSIDKATNLNFIEKIELRQELDKSVNGQWLPSKTSMMVDVSD